MASLFHSTRTPAAPTYGLSELRRRLGVEVRCSPARLVAYIDGLQTGYGFPPPIPLFWRGQWIERPHHRSQWQSQAVDAWFADRLPPDAAAAVDEAARAHSAAGLDAAAAAMFAGNVVQFPRRGEAA